MPVESISLTPDESYLYIKFIRGAEFHINVRDATIERNGIHDLDLYVFSNPDFVISITPSENSFTITIGHNCRLFIYRFLYGFYYTQ